MFKRFYIFFLFLLLGGCGIFRAEVDSKGGFSDSFTDVSEISLSSSEDFRVGMLLPLSGAAQKLGEGLKNAALMALEDVRNPNLVLQFYDTQSTASGARIAAENALNQNVRLILGPLTSEEASAIAPVARLRGVPVIAFSTSADFLQPGIYTLGLLVDEQVNRIVSFAAAQGRQRLALLVPDNKTGMAAARAAVKAAESKGITVSRIAFYPPSTSDFSAILKQMTDYANRSGRVNSLKNELQRRGDEESLRQLRQLKTIDSIGEVDFDAVLIPEYGARLTSAVSMFGYYDVFAPDVQFLGTSVWDVSSLNHETTLRGAWYPVMSRSYSGYFVNKYNNLFKEKPSSLYSLAYDAVALSSAVSKNQDKDVNEVLTDAGGYSGMNGAFRLFANGTNQHSLDIMEIRAKGNYVIDAGPKKFDTEQEFFEEAAYSATPVEQPKIYGKNPAAVYRELFGNMQ